MSFLPTFSLGNYLSESVSLPDDKEELKEMLKGILEEHARFINRKDTATYDEVELQSNQQFTGATPQQKRFGYRRIYEFGAIAAGATLVIAHNIAAFVEFTRIYGTCITNVVDYRPIPYTSVIAVNQQIQLVVTAANINILNGAAAAPITSGMIILEFLKQ